MSLKENLGLFDQQPFHFQGFNWNSHHDFNQHLAKQYISVISEKESFLGIVHNKKTALISIYKGKDNAVFQGIDPDYLFPKFEIFQGVDFDFQELADYESILIALFVPSAKPINHYGLETDLMKKIAELAENKNVELYLFGSPLSLNEIPKIEKFKKVVCAYQDFEVTQKETARYFQE